jgi:predicted transposase/invertase (TIGR01784 family)
VDPQLPIANRQPPSEALVVYIFILLKSDYSKEQIIQQITPDMATTFKSFYDKLIEEGI